MTDAFQKPPFQANAFQEQVFGSFSFQRCAFQFGAFQVDECAGSSAKSGVSRLWLMQMQEESLKQEREAKENAQTQAAEIIAKANEELGIVEKAVPKKTKPKVTTPVKKKGVVPFDMRPIYRDYQEAQNTADIGIYPILMGMTLEFTMLSTGLDDMQLRLLETLAANDDESDVELLLLAA